MKDSRHRFVRLQGQGRRLAVAGALAATIVPPASAQDVNDSAVEFSALYSSEVRANLSGGVKQGVRYLDNFDLQLTIDAESAIGWQGATAFLYALYNNGTTFSDDLVGDLQGVSNIETGIRAVRLYEAWIEQRFAGDAASIKVGLYDLNSEFDANDSAGLFINSSHGIGPDFSQTGQNGPSIFPVTSLAIRADYAFSDNWLARAAVLDGVPGDPSRPRRTVLSLGEGDGALFAGEVEFSDPLTKAGVGYWTYSASFQPLDGMPEKRGNNGFYLYAERVMIGGRDEPGSLAGWVRTGLADDRFNPFSSYLGGGLVYTGPFSGRSNDKLGIGIAAVQLGSPYRQQLARDGFDTDRSEINLELTYRAEIQPWLTVQPDLQLAFNPGGVAGSRTAVVPGLRVEVGF